MKIAVVMTRINKTGGIGRYLTEVIPRLKKGNEVHVFANSIEGMDTEGIVFHYVPALKKPFWLNVGLSAVLNTLRVRMYDFDIIYDQAACSLVPDVFVEHSCHRAYFFGIDIKRTWKAAFNPVHWVVLFLEKWGIERKSKRVIAVSSMVKKEVLHYYRISPDRVVVINNGVNLSEFSLGNKKEFRGRMRKRYGIRESDIVLLFVAHEFKRKGLEYVLGALKLLAERKKADGLKLVVVGRDDFVPYERIAKELGVSKNVVFAGPSKNVREFYAASDIFVFPTLYSPFDLVIPEALASGLPTITSRNSGAIDIIEDGEEGFLLEDPMDCGEIAAKVELLASSRRLLGSMGKKARKKAEQFTWDRTTEKVLDVFKEVVSEKKDREK